MKNILKAATGIAMLMGTAAHALPTIDTSKIYLGLTYITDESEAVDDKTGRIIPKGHIRGLLKAIDEISGWDRVETIKYCRERAINRFDKSKQLLKYAKIANSVH